MMKLLKEDGSKPKKNSPITVHEAVDVDQPANDESPAADIISHMLSVGAVNEKSQSHTSNYKLTMEVKTSTKRQTDSEIMRQTNS